MRSLLISVLVFSCCGRQDGSDKQESVGQSSVVAKAPEIQANVTRSILTMSPFANGVSGFIDMNRMMEHWTALTRDQPESAEQFLQALGPQWPNMKRFSGIMDKLEFFLEEDSVVRITPESAQKLKHSESAQGGSALQFKQIEGSVYVGKESQIAKLPNPLINRAIPTADVATLEREAFLGLLWHQDRLLLTSLSATSLGVVMAFHLPGKISESDRKEFRNIAMESGVVLEIENDRDTEILTFRGEPFTSLGLSAAILIPTIMKYNKKMAKP